MSFLTLHEIAKACNGSWQGDTPPDAACAGISTDSRTIEPGQAFLALVGPSHDGHAYLEQARERGAPCLIVDRETDADLPALRVDSTLDALGRIANAWRRALARTTVIAITGSNGKTTTVRLLTSILAQGGRTHASPKSYNNDIGVPLTIIGCPPDARFLVCEVGTNAPGEIDPLARIIEPDAAAITSIGRAHLEALKDLEGVAREKSAIFNHMRATDAPMLVPDSEGRLAFLEGTTPVRADTIEPTHDGTSFEVGGVAFRVPLLGAHNARNAAMAVTLARILGLDDTSIQKGLDDVAPPEHRLSVRTHAGVTVVNDAYNANPDSMAAALHVFADVSNGCARRVIVIGQMGELGDHDEAAHADLADEIANTCPPDLLITVGDSARATHDRASSTLPDAERDHLGTLTDDGATEIARRLRSGDALLLKGSRTNALERIDSALDSIHPAPCSTA